FRVLRLNFFLAIKQRLHRSLARSRLIRVKRFLDATKHDVQRNSLLLPRLHQRPIHRAQKQMLAASPDECVFDFGEVVEVIQMDTLSYTIRKPSSVRVSSMASIYFEASAISGARPPVATIRATGPMLSS